MAEKLRASNPIAPKFLRTTTLWFVPLFLWANAATAQCVMACQQNVQVALDASGQTVVTAALVAPFSVQNCGGAFEVTLFNAQNQPISGNILSCVNLNQTLNVRVKHVATGNLCWGSVVAKDYLPPTLVCPEIFIACTKDTAAQLLGFPPVSDNCTPLTSANLTWQNLKTDLPCMTLQGSQYVTARIDRTFSVKDNANNTTTCQQKIWVKRATLADVQMPPNLDGFAKPALDCGQNPQNLALTGQPAVEGKAILVDGDCELLVAFTDQNIPGCSPGSFRVLRSWTVSDYCANTFSIQVQVIKVDDKVAPVLTTPPNFTVGTGSAACTAIVNLPAGSATDACSAVSISTNSDMGNGFGPFPAVLLGDHVVTYKATDACGNTATGTLTVSVVDNKPPTAICRDLNVNLPAGGTTNLPATSLDNFSFDNCQLAPLTVSRDGQNFAQTVALSCADIGTPLVLTLRVTDILGNVNSCQSTINVRDNLKPSLQCPANKTVLCLSDTDPATLGQPLVSDNCGQATLTFSDVSQVNACHVGFISRTWVATDARGNSDSCIQGISLTSISSLTVNFPQDKTIATCSSSTDYAPAATGQATVSGQSCQPPSITFSDEKVTAPPACFNIIRKWKIIDWCVYDPNLGGPGLWEKTQIIKVYDPAPPAISPLPDVTVAANLPGCLAQVQLPDLTATDCGAVTISNNSIYATAKAANASGTYPVGQHVVTFSATDECTHTATFSLKIKVLDNVPPAAKCVQSFTLNLQTGGPTTVPANQLASQSTDNCSTQNDLKFTASPASFACASLGPQTVTVTVSDAAGNTSACATTISVADGLHLCLGGADVGGTVRTEGNLALANVPVVLTGDGFRQLDDCSDVGAFAFHDVPTGLAYHLRPENRNKWLNGVSTYDLLLIQKHILGIAPLPSPLKIIAADANHSNSITTFDVLQLRKMILGILDSLPGNSSWRFVPAGFQFSDPTNPFASAFPEELVYTALNVNQLAQDFVGIKVGDVNLSANAADSRTPTDTVFLHVENRSLTRDFPMTLPVKIGGWARLDGLQFDLWIDPKMATMRGVDFPKNGRLGAENLTLNAAAGRVSVSWDYTRGKPAATDSLIFTLNLDSHTDASVGEILKIEASRLSPEAYPTGGKPTEAVDLQLVGDPWRRGEWRVLPCIPNPFLDETLVPFVLPVATEVTLTVSDAVGRVVFQRVEKRSRGYNELRIRRENLPGPGVYFFQLTTPETPGMGGKVILD